MRRRRGLTLFELIVALFIMTTAMTAIVQLLAVAASQRRMLDQRRVALLETANYAERIALLPWTENPNDALRWEPAADVKQKLPGVEWVVNAVEEQTVEEKPQRSRRIHLSAVDVDKVGRDVVLAELTVWQFAPGGEP